MEQTIRVKGCKSCPFEYPASGRHFCAAKEMFDRSFDNTTSTITPDWCPLKQGAVKVEMEDSTETTAPGRELFTS